MGAAANMPDIKSGLLIQLSELDSWEPDEVHGSSVRVLGRICAVNAAAGTVQIEYHGRTLRVLATLLNEFGAMRIGMLFQFLGELCKNEGETILKARICRDMSGLDSDLYDRCLRIRREFESRLLSTDNG